MSQPLYRDRRHAGRSLAGLLTRYVSQPDVVVWGLPRGGLPVAFEVAQALHSPLDAVIVRKLGVPGHKEYAMGAIASGGTRVLKDEVIRSRGLSGEEIEAETAMELVELQRRERLYRGGRPPLSAKGHTVILVDDGLATGATMQAAVRAVRQLGPRRVIVAVPVASAESCASLRAEADEIVCGATPRPFEAVGLWYDDFTQTSDEEVQDYLRSSTFMPGKRSASST